MRYPDIPAKVHEKLVSRERGGATASMLRRGSALPLRSLRLGLETPGSAELAKLCEPCVSFSHLSIGKAMLGRLPTYAL